MTSIRNLAISSGAALSALAILAPAAGAAIDAPDIFVGTAEAKALDLRVAAPAGLLDAVTGGGPLLQEVSLTRAELSSDGIADATTTLLAGLMNQGLKSDGSTTSDKQSIQEMDLGLLQVGLGTLEYTADAAAGVSRSASELANLTVSLSPLFDGLVPAEIAAPVEDAVGQVTDVVNGLVDELNGALGQVEDAIEEVRGGTGLDIPDVLPNQLPALPDVTEVTLVDVRKLWSVSSVTTSDGKVRSETNTGIAEASLLGGLIEVPALQYTSWAETAGTAGTADAGYDITTIAVRVGDSEVGVSGTTLTVGDLTIDLASPDLAGLPAEELLDDVTGVLGDLLNSVGLSVSQGAGAVDIAPDGSAASAATSALSLRVSPLHAIGQAEALSVELDLLPTRSAVSGGTAPGVNAPPAAAPPTPAEPSLPRTGGGAVALLLGGVAFGGLGMLRKRG